MTPNEIEGLQLRYELALNGRREAEAALNELRPFLRHSLVCNPRHECTCGLDATLAKVDASPSTSEAVKGG